MRHVCLLVVCMGVWTVSSASAGTLHRVYGTVVHADGSTPASVNFTAYITTRTGETLIQISTGCSYASGTWSVQCGSFPTQWAAGQILHVDFSGAFGTGSVEVILTNNAEDPAGRTMLVSSPSSVKLVFPNTTILRGETAEIPLSVENLTPADSVLAFQITMAFDKNVLTATGASNAGTMTAYWTGIVAGARESDMSVAGFTTNLTGAQLVTDSGNLVKLNFLADGLVGTQTTLRLTEAVIYTKTAAIPVAHTRCGAVTVSSGSSTVTRTLNIYPGWNLISLAAAPDSNTISGVLNGLSINYLLGYVSGVGPRTWSAARPSFLNDLQSLDGTHGYWVKSTSASTQVWNVSGNPIPATTQIPLYSGWNLIGYLPSSTQTLEVALPALGSAYSYIMGYVGSLSGGSPKTWSRSRADFLNDLKDLSPLSGYWVKMDSAKNLVYAKAMEAPESANQDVLISNNPIPTSCEFWGWQTDFFHQGDTIRVYAPNGILCGDTVVTAEGAFLVHVNGDDPETADIIEGPEIGDTLTFTLNGDSVAVSGVSANMESDIIPGMAAVFLDMNSFKIQLEAIVSGVNDNAHPESFIFANYPNPFNGRTMIYYSLISPCKIQLTVYDAAGRVARRLIDNQIATPGSHRLAWDGLNDSGTRVPSGIYFARLRMENGIKTIKLVLIN